MGYLALARGLLANNEPAGEAQTALDACRRLIKSTGGNGLLPMVEEVLAQLAALD